MMLFIEVLELQLDSSTDPAGGGDIIDDVGLPG